MNRYSRWLTVGNAEVVRQVHRNQLRCGAPISGIHRPGKLHNKVTYVIALFVRAAEQQRLVSPALQFPVYV